MGKSTNKDRSKQTRTYDPDGYRRRADPIIFRDTTYTEVLLVSSRSEPDNWTLPGGGMEPNESGRTTSVREAKEEAGVVGTVKGYVGTFDNVERKTRTEVYILVADEMIDRWDDKDEINRKRKWFPLDEAVRQTSRRPGKQSYLKAACDVVRNMTKERETKDHSYPYAAAAVSLVCLALCVFCFSLYLSW